MGWGFRWLSIAGLLLAISAAARPATCADMLASGGAVRRTIASAHPRIVDALPEYDSREEMLLVFLRSGHLALYFGDYFWNWGKDPLLGYQYEVRHHPRALSEGVVIRVRIGASAVQRLAKATDEGSYRKLDTGSCQHNALLFLLQNGVRLRGRIPFSAEAVFHQLLEEGFEDAQGTQLPQALYELARRSEKELAELRRNLRKLASSRAFFLLTDFVTPSEVLSLANSLDATGRFAGDVRTLWRALTDERATDAQKAAFRTFLSHFDTALSRLQREHLGDPREVVLREAKDPAERQSSNAHFLRREAAREALRALQTEPRP